MGGDSGNPSKIAKRNNPAKRSKLDNMIENDAEMSGSSKDMEEQMSGNGSTGSSASSSKDIDTDCPTLLSDNNLQMKESALDEPNKDESDDMEDSTENMENSHEAEASFGKHNSKSAKKEKATDKATNTANGNAGEASSSQNKTNANRSNTRSSRFGARIYRSQGQANSSNGSSMENDDLNYSVSTCVEDSGYAENQNKDFEKEASSSPMNEKNETEEKDSTKDPNEAGTSSSSSSSGNNSEVKRAVAELTNSRVVRNRTNFSRSGWRTRLASRNYRSQILYTSSSEDEDDQQQMVVETENTGGSDRESSVSDDEEADNISQQSHDRRDSDSSLTSLNSSSESDEPGSPFHGQFADVTKELLLAKSKPEYNWNLVHEVMYREHGLSGKGRQTLRGRDPYSFQERNYAARHTIEKMKLYHKLEGHNGCVNSLNFNRAGDLLVSGSDDLKIKIWKWASNEVTYSFNSGHNSNVFQTKFLDFSNNISIISSARDGQVRHSTIPSSGGKPISTVLITHLGSVHKIALCPQNPYEVITAGEDAHVIRCDLRDNRREPLVTVRVEGRKVPLYSVAHHPFDQEFCVCGRDQFVRVYDKRNLKTPQVKMCPGHLEDKKPFTSHITCAVYNWNGSEILASYSDDDVYLFNNRCYLPGHFTHRYQGHYNNKTIKGVNYFGLNSEYVVSGSDCGNFFIWEKNSEAIMNWTKGDFTGVVNCLEPHPTFPVMATSGLDSSVKIWMPLKPEFPPQMQGLEKCIRSNMKRSHFTDNDFLFDDTTFYFFVRQCLRNRRSNNETETNCPTVQDLLSSDSGDEYDYRLRDESFQQRCSPQ